MISSTSRFAITVTVAVLGVVRAGGLGAQGPIWLTGDRVHVSDGGTLHALALGPREVFAAGDAGVLAWDFTRNRWNLPVAPIGEFLAGDRITGLAHDFATGELYLATARGDTYRFTPAFDRWERVGDTAGDALPPGIRAALERRAGGPRDPVLDAVRGSLGTDARLRRWPITDILAGERPGEYWVATDGGGLLRFESRGLVRDWMRWGLLSRGTAALAFDGERVWFGGDGRSPRNGVAAADPSLGAWWQFDAADDGAPAGFVAEMLSAGDHIWFASSDGVYRFDARALPRAGRSAWRRFTTRDGLLSFEATALARAGETVWAGTRAGLAAIIGEEVTGTLLPGRPVYRLAVRGDTLWIASADGLHIVPRASTSPDAAVPAPGVAQVAVFRSAVEDLVAGADAIYALAAASESAPSPPQAASPSTEPNK
ncbi:MAG: hypothetical protein L0271_07005, partial [Gemmatimonadetes bacterium]|nr:hypothetical protein [Gemmatimonadota bacterium]